MQGATFRLKGKQAAIFPGKEMRWHWMGMTCREICMVLNRVDFTVCLVRMRAKCRRTSNAANTYLSARILEPVKYIIWPSPLNKTWQTKKNYMYLKLQYLIKILLISHSICVCFYSLFLSVPENEVNVSELKLRGANNLYFVVF